MRRLLLPVATLFLTLVSGRGLEAQGAELLPALRPGSVLRVEERDGTRMQGVLVSQNRTMLTLRQDHSARQLALTDLNRVWVRRRSTGTGAIVGSLAGAAAGGIIFNFFARAGCESSNCHITETTLAGVGLGAAGGALVGAVIGAAIPHWRLRFP